MGSGVEEEIGGVAVNSGCFKPIPVSGRRGRAAEECQIKI